MKAISLILVFCFSFNVMAAKTNLVALEAVVEEYHYAMTVEWDQKDKAYQEKAYNEFVNKLSIVLKEESLTNKDLMNFLSSKIKNKALLDSIELKSSLLRKDSSSLEFATLMKEISNGMYAQGASWNGEVVWSVFAISFVVIGFIILAVNSVKAQDDVCQGTVVWQDHYGNSCDPAFAIDNCYDYCYGN